MADRTIRDLILDNGANAVPAPDFDFARIKRNVGRMLDQGASEAEVDAYVAGEGTSADELRDHRAEQPNITADAAGQFGKGVNRGIDSLINMPYNAIRAGANLFGADLPEAHPIVGAAVDAAERAVTGGNIGQAQTAAGRYAGTIGEVAGASVIPQAALMSRTAQAAE